MCLRESPAREASLRAEAAEAAQPVGEEAAGVEAALRAAEEEAVMSAAEEEAATPPVRSPGWSAGPPAGLPGRRSRPR